MKLNFISLHSNIQNLLFQDFDKNENTLFVFPNSSTAFEIKKEYFKINNDFFPNFKILNERDFFEKILHTDKLIIKEEKQVVFFYNSLTKKLKKELNIQDYFSVIDIAYNFYNLLAELQEYKIDLNEIKVEEWQKPIFKNLLEIKDLLTKNSNKLSLALPYMIRNIENLSFNFLKKYKKIVFINKINFTPFECELFEIIKNEGIEIENILQLEENDFNKSTLKIKESISLPDIEDFKKINSNIKIYEFESKFSQLLNVMEFLNNDDFKNVKLYDAEDIDQVNYQLINQNLVAYNLEITLKSTKIYKVLNCLYEILNDLKIVSKGGKKEYLFNCKSLFFSFKYNEFLNTFNISKSDYKVFQKLINEKYKYLSVEILEKIKNNENIFNFFKDKEEELNKLILFFKKIQNISQITTLENYKNFLENDLDSLFENEKIRDKYFEALSEIVVLEDFPFINKWKNFFSGNISASLLKIFLKYLDKKSISLDLEEEEENNINKFKIDSFNKISNLSKDKLIFLNLQNSFPKISVNDFLFSKIQRKKMGLPTSEELKSQVIFHFINNIFNCNENILCYVKNIDENINSSSIVEELILKYDINISKDNMKEEEELEFIKKYFSKDDISFERKKIGPFIKSKLKKNSKKLLENDFSLNPYILGKIENSEYYYYLEKMIGETELEKIENVIDFNILGNIIHNIYEIIIKKNKENFENKKYELNNKDIEEALMETLIKYDYKIPKEFMQFYKKISFNEIASALVIFFNGLFSEVIPNIFKNNNFTLETEKNIENIVKNPFKKYKNITPRGIIDLYISSSFENIIIDYKSGKLSKDKLKNAQKQLDFYSILLNENNCSNYIVNPWNGELITDTRNESDKYTMEKIEEILFNYFYGEYYSLENSKESPYSPYVDIARRKDELDEK